MKLFGTSVSPYVRKVMNVLDYKQLDYSHEENLPSVLIKALGKEVPADFQKASPLGKIPALAVDGHSIPDSAVIVAYLEHHYPEQSVYPLNSLDLADALWLEKYSDGVMAHPFRTRFLEQTIKYFSSPANFATTAS